MSYAWVLKHLCSCEKLRGTGRGKDSRCSTVEEQVAKFLHIIGHNVKNKTMSFFFHHSRETISCHFHNVLCAIISLEEEFIVHPLVRMSLHKYLTIADSILFF